MECPNAKIRLDIGERISEIFKPLGLENFADS